MPSNRIGRRYGFAASLFALTVVAFAAAFYWGLPPLGALNGLRAMGVTSAEIIRERVPIHLVSPSWISGKDGFDFEVRWSAAECAARLLIVFILWFIGTIVLHYRTKSD